MSTNRAAGRATVLEVDGDRVLVSLDIYINSGLWVSLEWKKSAYAALTFAHLHPTGAASACPECKPFLKKPEAGERGAQPVGGEAEPAAEPMDLDGQHEESGGAGPGPAETEAEGDAELFRCVSHAFWQPGGLNKAVVGCVRRFVPQLPVLIFTNPGRG